MTLLYRLPSLRMIMYLFYTTFTLQPIYHSLMRAKFSKKSSLYAGCTVENPDLQNNVTQRQIVHIEDSNQANGNFCL